MRGAKAATVVPTVVVRDELREGRLEEYCKLPNLYENFFAISIKRHFQQPLVKTLLSRSEADVLAGAEPSGARKKTARRG